MMGLPLGFAQPLVLLGLLSLPVLWWLLRLVPPRPQQINFPPTRLLFEIAPKEETPARTPWWLILLRLTLAALVIIAAAGPLWNPPIAASSRGAPLLLMIDDGWAAAASWDERLRTADELIARAEADNRGVAFLPLSQTGRDISLQVAGAARVQARQLQPQPYGIDRGEALPLIGRFLAQAPDVEIVWLSDGVDLGKGGEFIDGLKKIVGNHPLTVVSGGIAVPRALAAADNAAGALTVKVLRPQSSGAEAGLVKAIDLKGLPLGEAPFAFKTGAREADASIDLPVEIRNDVARLEIVGERSAGAVQLLDKRWRRRTVGIVSGSAADRSQPLIGATYYLARALNPFADVRLAEGVAPGEAVNRFLNQHMPMMILADVGNVAEARDALLKWIENGGVLVRFAGPHLARHRRRSGAGEAAPRRPHPRRQPELGQAAKTRRLLAREPVLRHAGAERRHRHPPGAGRARRAAARTHVGDARRRHAAGHRAAPRQGAVGAVPRHRRHALVRPAAVRAPSSTCCAAWSRSRMRPPAARPRAQPTPTPGRWCRRAACSTASAPSRCRRRPRAACRPISTRAAAPIIRPASTGRPRAWSRSIRWRPMTGRRRSISPASMPGSTSTGMASRSTCAGRSSSPRSACCCSTRCW